MLKFLHGQKETKILAPQKQTNKLRQNYSKHYSFSNRRAYKCTSTLAFGATLPHCLLVFVCFPFSFFGRWGITTTTTMTLLHLTSRPNVSICRGAFGSPQLLCEHEVKRLKRREDPIHSSQPNCLAGCYYCF